MVVTRDQEVRYLQRYWSNGTKLQQCWINKSGKLMYSMMIIVNDTTIIYSITIVLNNGDLLKE